MEPCSDCSFSARPPRFAERLFIVDPLLLVGLSGVLEPTGLMATASVSMGPMDYAAFIVPLEDAVESDGVTHLQRGKTRREVDVVSHEQRLAGSQGENKALVTAAVVIIGKQPCDGSLAGDLCSARLCGECPAQGVALCRCNRNVRLRRAAQRAQSTGLTQAEVEGGDGCTCE